LGARFIAPIKIIEELYGYRQVKFLYKYDCHRILRSLYEERLSLVLFLSQNSVLVNYNITQCRGLGMCSHD